MNEIIIQIPLKLLSSPVSIGDKVYWNVKSWKYNRVRSKNNYFVGHIKGLTNDYFKLIYNDDSLKRLSIDGNTIK